MNQSRPKVRISRALGIALTPKCVKYFEKRPFPPGVHGRRRRNQSDYAVRLMEKQRLRHQYNLSEGQLSREEHAPHAALADAVTQHVPAVEHVALLQR